MRLNLCLKFRCSPYSTSRVQENLFVPKHEPVKQEDIEKLEKFLMDKPNTLVVTGAGISTESGVPDYRSKGVGLYERKNHKPIQHQEFVKSAEARRRYWARNFVGWDTFSRREPNPTHYALAKFEREARISAIITQNVDRLHTKAGSKNVIEIHGSGYEVGCLSCDYEINRHEFQIILRQVNPSISDAVIYDMIRPDGDVEIPQETIDRFVIPDCPRCGSGHLKPKIVFFGDNVPQDRILRIVRLITESDAILALGTSLTVFSGYRIILQAKELGIPVAIVNIGETRADKIVDLKISAKVGDVIPKIFNFDKKH